ncbi:hypothetical protein CR513_48144, partial [Mucuna pruriens]
MKFPIGQKVGSVWADSHVARRCYEDNLRVGSHPPKSTWSVVNVGSVSRPPMSEAGCPKEAQVRRREAKGCPWGNKQTAGRQVHKGSTIRNLASQRGDGQEGQW